MQIQNNYNINFRAKFLDSESLHQVVNYAIEHNKARQLNEARKNIEASYLPIRIKFDMIEDEKGLKKFVFTRFKPKSFVVLPKNYDDYIESKPIEYVNNTKKSTLAYALDLLIKMGSCVPNNKVFKRVVVNGGNNKK